MATYKTTQRWRHKARRWITRYAGNKCQCCGYDKWIGNLVFHHIRDKIKDVSRLINATASWASIVKEVDKCVLVCHNCHGEIHAGLRDCPKIDMKEREKILKEIIAEQPLPKTKQFHNCNCGKRIPKTKKYCSQRCHHRNSETTKWPDDLPKLVANSSQSAVARMLNVSDKAVEKRLRNHHQRPATGIEPAMG